MSAVGNPGAGDGSVAPALGSLYTADGVRMSARIAAKKSRRDFTDADAKALLSLLQPGASGGKKMRGGDSELVDELINKILLPFGERAIEYFKSKFGRVAVVGEGVAKIAATSADSLIDASIATVLLAVAGVAGTAGTAAQAIRNYTTAAATATDNLMSTENQKIIADKATGSAGAVATTMGVVLLTANTAGVLPLATILTSMLYGAGVALSPQGRASTIAMFYGWYLSLSAEEQKKVMDAAKEYTTAVHKNPDNVDESAAKVANAVAGANATVPETKTGKTTVDITKEDLKATAKVAGDTIVTTAIAVDLLDAVEKAKVPPPGSRAKPGATALKAAAADAAKAAKAAKPVFRTSDTSERRVTRSMQGMPSATAGPPGPTAVSGAVSALGPTGGRRRKTRSKKTKRRVTRRRSMPTFAY